MTFDEKLREILINLERFPPENLSTTITAIKQAIAEEIGKPLKNLPYCNKCFTFTDGINSAKAELRKRLNLENKP